MESTKTVWLQGSSGGRVPGTIRIESRDRQARVRQALKWLGIVWGCALFAVLLPLAHFILVPSFALAGPIVALLMYQERTVALGGESRCPKCGAPFPISRGKLEWPLKDVCASCYENVVITPEEGAAGAAGPEAAPKT